MRWTFLYLTIPVSFEPLLLVETTCIATFSVSSFPSGLFWRIPGSVFTQLLVRYRMYLDIECTYRGKSHQIWQKQSSAFVIGHFVDTNVCVHVFVCHVFMVACICHAIRNSALWVFVHYMWEFRLRRSFYAFLLS